MGVYMYQWVYIYVCIYGCVCICTWVYICIYMTVYICIYVSIQMYVYMGVLCMYIWMYICIYMGYISTYICIYGTGPMFLHSWGRWPRRWGALSVNRLWRPPASYTCSGWAATALALAFLSNMGMLGEEFGGDLLPRRLCTRNQRRVWVFKLLLCSVWLLTDRVLTNLPRMPS